MIGAAHDKLGLRATTSWRELFSDLAEPDKAKARRTGLGSQSSHSHENGDTQGRRKLALSVAKTISTACARVERSPVSPVTGSLLVDGLGAVLVGYLGTQIHKTGLVLGPGPEPIQALKPSFGFRVRS